MGSSPSSKRVKRAGSVGGPGPLYSSMTPHFTPVTTHCPSVALHAFSGCMAKSIIFPFPGLFFLPQASSLCSIITYPLVHISKDIFMLFFQTSQINMLSTFCNFSNLLYFSNDLEYILSCLSVMGVLTCSQRAGTIPESFW